MVICPECHKQMDVIGIEKFLFREESDTNFSVDGIGYKIFVVKYCRDCNVLFIEKLYKVYEET